MGSEMCIRDRVRGMTPKNRDFHDFSSFLETCRGTPGKRLGCAWNSLGPFRVVGVDFRASKRFSENLKNRYFLRSLRLENRLSMVWELIPVMDGRFWKKSKKS